MIDRRTFSVSLAAGVATSVLGVTGNAQSAANVSNVVFVHGAYADGSCWAQEITSLQAAGFNVTSVQNHLVSFADDVASAKRALAMQTGPTVMVAHSYGGMILTETGVDPKVTAVVYIAARAPDAGENYTALAMKYPTPPANAGLVAFQGYEQLNETAFLNDFANGVDPVVARQLYAVQAPISTTLFAGAKTTVAAWRTKPSFYAVSKADRTINPDLERFMASRMKATTIEIDAGHLSLVSHPKEVTDLILKAAGR